MKAITADNYIVRPFVTHKTQTYGYAFLSGGNPAQVSIDLAVVPPTSASWQFLSASEPQNPSGIYQRPLYESVKHMFYENTTEDRGFEPTGSALYVVSLAQNSYGEQIKPGSFHLTEGSSTGSIVDDGQGGLVFSGSVSSSMFRYTVGDDITALGGTFIGPASRSYRDADGYLKFVGENVPRDGHYVHNPMTGQFERTLLYEPTRENLFPASTDFEGVSWGKVQASFSSSMIVAPDGEGLAGKLIESLTTSSVSHYVARGQAWDSAVTYSLSVWAKAEERHKFQFYFVHSSGSVGIIADATTGEVTTAGRTYGAGKVFSTSSVEYANGWRRFGFTGAFTSSAVPPNGSVVILLASGSGGSTGYLGDGTSGMYFYGAQMELGTGVSSYIPTSGATVTRLHERFYFPFTEIPQEMTTEVDFIDQGVGSFFYPRIFSIGGHEGPMFELYNGSGGLTTNFSNGDINGLAAVNSLVPYGTHVRATAHLFESGSGFRVRTSVIRNGVEINGIPNTGSLNIPTAFKTPRLWIGSNGNSFATSGMFALKEINVSRKAIGDRVGNIFYANGIAVINKTEHTSRLGDAGLNLVTGSATSIRFDATHTIYEHNVICTLDQGELNYTSNPSLKQTALDGSKVIDHMATGSLQPYMTQIGLYNDDGELVAIAKFPRPLKRAVGSQQTVIVRFDA